MGGLSSKRRRFVKEYLIDHNGKQAAIRAGYSPRTATVQGSKLLTYPNVRAAVDEGLAVQLAKATMTADEVIRGLTLLARANMIDYMTIGTNGDPFVDLTKLTRDQAAAISEVTVEDFVDGRGEDARDVRRIKFKLADKRAALVDLGKHFGMFIERHAVEVGGHVSHDWTVKVVAPGGVVTSLPGAAPATIDAQVVPAEPTTQPRARRLPDLSPVEVADA